MLHVRVSRNWRQITSLIGESSITLKVLVESIGNLLKFGLNLSLLCRRQVAGVIGDAQFCGVKGGIFLAYSFDQFGVSGSRS